MAQLCCKNVGFAYGGEPVLSGVNFSVNAGDYLCIVGENGSGKSTLVKTLVGLVKPVSGDISCTEKRIGYLPQQTGIQRDFPASVGEVVLSGRISGMGHRLFYSRADREAASENLERMGIEELKDRCYMELSGGQQQRVLLARAMCATKKLLLLDEPVTGLDPNAANEMYNLIKLINLCDKISVIMVTHDVHEAVRYATHILHLGHGQLFFGSVEEYRKSDHVRRLLGGGTL